MHTPNPSAPDAHVMEAYRRQMLEMYRQAAPSSPAGETEDNWLDRRYPAPDIRRDKEAMAPPETAPVPEPPPTVTESASAPDTAAFVGYLRIYAFTGGGAEPIEGARVVVTRPDGDTQTIYANLTTDADGFTPVIALPSVDPALSLRPGNAQPYVTYSVEVVADGFRPAAHRNVPVYGNNYATQPVAMLPLLVGEDADDTQEFTSGGPANL